MSIEQRLLKLESERRVWRFVALFFAITAGLVCGHALGLGSKTIIAATAADAPAEPTVDTLRAHEIQIVDENGAIVGSWSGSGLRVRNPKNELEEVTVYPTGVYVKDDGYMAKVSPGAIGVSRANQEHLREYLKARAAYEVAKTKNAVTAVIAQDARKTMVAMLTDVEPLVHMGALEQGGGGVAVFNSLGKAVVDIQSNKTNAGWIGVGDVNGKITNDLAAH
jgi:hypothetical protein